jgi:hypothetical protein
VPVGLSVGRAVGEGAGISAMFMKTNYVGKLELYELPPRVREVLEKTLSVIETIYAEQCKQEKCQ